VLYYVRFNFPSAFSDYQFLSLQLENGFYDLSASSRQPGHNENHARRGDIWQGWKPEGSDLNPQLNIDLE